MIRIKTVSIDREQLMKGRCAPTCIQAVRENGELNHATFVLKHSNGHINKDRSVSIKYVWERA